MPLPQLPDWLPWWVPILVLVPVLLWALAFLFMPFAVFGTKGRLEAIEARLDELQGEIRNVALRMPEPVHHSQYDETIYAPPSEPSRARPEPTMSRPPIPPAPYYDHEDRIGEPRGQARPEQARAARQGRADPRSEPRLDWPR